MAITRQSHVLRYLEVALKTKSRMFTLLRNFDRDSYGKTANLRFDLSPAWRVLRRRAVDDNSDSPVAT